MESVNVAIGGGDDRDDLKTKTNDAAGSEGGTGDATMKTTTTIKIKPWEEEGGILKLKKAAMAAMHLWLGTRPSDRTAVKDAREKMAQLTLGARKKKKKVVKSRLPKALIDHIAESPLILCQVLSDEKLAQRTHFHQTYAALKVFEAKNIEYWDALVDQQKELGYAEDEIETEVTDDDEEEEEMMVENSRL